MYEDLVNRLNAYSAEHQKHGGITAEAADAIDELVFACNHYEKDYKALCKYLPKWISVTEQLPEHTYGEGTSVLTIDLYGAMRVAYFDGGNWCWPTGEMLTTMRVAPITHWMSLPHPPKEDS